MNSTNFLISWPQSPCLRFMSEWKVFYTIQPFLRLYDRYIIKLFPCSHCVQTIKFSVQLILWICHSCSRALWAHVIGLMALNGQKKGKLSYGIFPSGLYCSSNSMDQRKSIFSFTMLSNMSQSISGSVQWKSKSTPLHGNYSYFISFESLFKAIMQSNRWGHQPQDCRTGSWILKSLLSSYFVL